MPGSADTLACDYSNEQSVAKGRDMCKCLQGKGGKHTIKFHLDNKVDFIVWELLHFICATF